MNPEQNRNISLRAILDSTPVPTFVIDEQHRVTHWNRACQEITRKPAEEMIGTANHRHIFYDTERPTMADLIVDGAPDALFRVHYRDKRLTRSPFIAGAYEAEDYFPTFGHNGCWLYFTAAPLINDEGKVIGAIETLQDVSERRRAEEALVQHQRDLERQVKTRTNELAEAQQQLIQSEKLASIGQLAAGVAHEINNPIGFVNSNMRSLEHYFSRLLQVLEHFDRHRERIADSSEFTKAWVAEVEALKKEADYAYLKDDIPALLAESREGTERVRRIVQDLRDFSRADTAQQWERADLRTGLNSTLNIVANEIKYRADVIKEYGDMPLVACIPSQLNQVFMNLMVNAAHAIPEDRRGSITLRCGSTGAEAWVEVADNGTGIAEENLKKIFDPFFTTKPLGKGTGLGLSLSYGIVEKHNGRIEVRSTPGAGTTFRVTVPVEQQPAGSRTDQAPRTVPAAPTFEAS